MIAKERLKELVKKLDLKQYQFAQAIGVSGATVSDWFNTPNVNPSIESLIRIADVYKVNINWLLTGEGSIFIDKVPAREKPTLPHTSSTLIKLPVVADIAAGNGIEAYDVEPSEYISLDRGLLTLPGPYLCFRVAGDSMAPDIHPGDYAIVTQSWADLDFNDRICAFRTIEGLTLKRFYIPAGRKSALLIPLNTSYPVIKYTQDSPDYTLLGLLIITIRKYI